MTNIPERTVAPSVTLSDEELQVLLLVTKLRGVPMLAKPAPRQPLSDEQQAYGLMVAERSLRARGMARLNGAGELEFPTDLLRLVATCALAEESLYVTPVAMPAAIGQRVVIHRQGDHHVLYQQPAARLHAFSALEGWSEALALIGQSVGWPAETSVDESPLLVAGELLAALREQAAHSADAAQRLLRDAGAPEAASALAALLAQPHGVTVLQHTRVVGADLHLQSVTVLHNQAQLWLAVEADDQSAEGERQYRLQPVSRSQLYDYLNTLVQ